MKISTSVSHLFPVAILLLLPFYAWAILIIPSIAAQWTVEPRYRHRVTAIYVVAVVVSVTAFVFSQSLMPR